MLNRTQIWIYLVCSLLVADFVLFGYLPAKRQLDGLRQVLAQEQHNQQLAQYYRRQLSPLRQRLSDLDQQLLAYSRLIPKDPQIGTFIQDLCELMRGRLSNYTLVPSGPQQADGIWSTQVQVGCEGTLPDIYAFLKDLRSAERLVRITGLRICNDRSITGRLKAEMELEVFNRGTSDAD